MSTRIAKLAKTLRGIGFQDCQDWDLGLAIPSGNIAIPIKRSEEPLLDAPKCASQETQPPTNRFALYGTPNKRHCHRLRCFILVLQVECCHRGLSISNRTALSTFLDINCMKKCSCNLYETLVKRVQARRQLESMPERQLSYIRVHKQHFLPVLFCNSSSSIVLALRNQILLTGIVMLKCIVTQDEG